MRPNAKKGIALAAGAVALAAAFITPWEGLYTRPYNDIVGVRTVCIGETENVQERLYSKQECTDMLAAKLPRYYAEISSCWGSDVEAILTDNMRVAFVSGAYNFGSGAFCNSTMVRRLKAGDRRGACHALRLYNRAGGRVVRGLENRRVAEEKLCLKGI